MPRIVVQPFKDSYAAIAALVDSGRHDEAERQARDLVREKAEDGAAWRTLGYALLGRSNFAEAEAAFRRAVALEPKDFRAFEHLGWLYHRTGQPGNAIVALQSSLAIEANRVRPRVILANVMATLGKSRQAAAHYERVLSQAPDHFRTHNNLANILVGMGRLQLAATHYARAAALAPDLTYQISAAHLARRICDWTTAESFEPKILAALRSGPKPTDRTQPFPILAVPQATAQDLLTAAGQMARHHTSATPIPHRPPAELAAEPRLRIGYLSPDLLNHATAHLIVEVLELHDRSRFEIVAFDYSRDQKNAYRDRILAAFDKVVGIRGVSDFEAAGKIVAEDIAIMVDLAGWTTGSRSQILAHRPAPLCAQWLGNAGSLGAPWIDYIIADHLVAPNGHEAEFSEKLLRLPHCYQPNDRQRQIGAKVTRADMGLPDEAFVFCCFNQPFKITRETFDLWMELLRQRPGAVLWLLDDNRWATEALKAQTAAHGIAAERVIFGARLPLAQHLARLRLADLALDCPPCGSHTTASDALWAGTPHLALRGGTFSSRVSASLLNAVGLPELITDNVDSYRELALGLSRYRAQISVLKARLASLRLSAPLFDSRLFSRHLEAGYEAIWQRCCDGLAPDHIGVPAGA